MFEDSTADSSGRDVAVLRERLCVLDARRCAAEAELLVALGEFAAVGGHEADGAGSLGSWVAHRLEYSDAGARAVVKVAQSLVWMPVSVEAMLAGGLSPAKVALLAKAGRQVPDEAFGAAESFLVGLVADLSVRDAATALRFWVANVQAADGTYQDAAGSNRLFVAETFRGNVEISGRLDPESGAIVAGELNRLAEQLRASAADGEPVPVFQRRAEALVEMARRSIRASDDPNALPPVPLITAIIDVSHLFHTEPTNPANGTEPATGTTTEPEAAPDTPAVVLPGLGDGVVGELAPGVPLTGDAARRLMCDAGIARVVFGADGEPVELGRVSYTPSRAQRRALVARDRGCVFPGCHQPPSRCDAHHIVHWTNNGPTNLQNLALVCRYHHHKLHEGGYTLQRTTNGTHTIHRPDGTALLDPRNQAPPGHNTGHAA